MPQRIPGGPNEQVKRLFLKDGDWTLEVEYLKAIMGGTVLRPTVRRVFGKQAILATLDRVAGQTNVVLQARELLARESTDAGYEVVQGQWIQREKHAVDEMIEAIRAEAQQESLRTRESQASAPLTELLSQRMEARLTLIEQRLAHLESVIERQRMAPQIAVPHRFESGDVHIAPTPVSEAPQADLAHSEPEAAGDHALEPESTEVGAPAIPIMPRNSALAEVLKILIDEVVALSPAGKPLDLRSGVFISDLIDDDDNPVGALILDTAGANNLGGKLMMIPDGTIDEMIANKEVSQDTLDGASEVLNTLSSCFNKLKENPHVRTTPAVVWDPERHGWTEFSSRRVDFHVDPWGGMLVLVSK